MFHINWLGYYNQNDGYGRFNSRMLNALSLSGISIKGATLCHIDMPEWMLEKEGIDWNDLTISCMPPYMVRKVPSSSNGVPGRHWLFSMTEGSILLPAWVEIINNSGVERVIVPCEHNKRAFMDSGVICPVHVVPGGIDPQEFPVLKKQRKELYPPYYDKPYTFLTLADRGMRKGWEEVLEAFYIAFGGKTSGCKDVQLIIKARPGDNVLDYIINAEGKDSRLVCLIEDSNDIYNIYSKCDVLALPSRSEGWGMPHREAACMGLPVLVQQYSGLDDGFTDRWCIPVTGGKMHPMPKEAKTFLGEWMIADKVALAEVMRRCYDSPEWARQRGGAGARWIRKNQTWIHSATALLDLVDELNNVPSVIQDGEEIQQEDRLRVGCSALPLAI